MSQVVPQCCSAKMYSKVSKSRKFKNILKPVLRRLFKLSNRKPIKSHEARIAKIEEEYDVEWMSETSDNDANEDLEQRLIEDIQNSPTDAAIFIFNEDGSARLQQIDRQKFYIPVHFARTNAGTFFWTSAQKSEPMKIEWTFLDRWAQA